MATGLVDLEFELHHETERAILVSVDGNRAGAVWLPKSAIEFSARRDRPTIIDVTMPESMAIAKGLA